MFFKNAYNRMMGKYINHPETVIITCYYNPKNSPERLNVFNKFYESIKHLNHRIIECAVGDASFQLPQSPHIERIHTQSNLWHKEQLLNRIIRDLPKQFKYVLWVDADILFTNKNWMVDAANQLQNNRLIQLFEYCVHLEKGQSKPAFDIASEKYKILRYGKPSLNARIWKGYAANFVTSPSRIQSQDYDYRGHVGFAWGARREILEKVPLFDKALIGGADGIIAYASTGQLRNMKNISDMFDSILPDVLEWGDSWYNIVQNKVGYVKGDVYHLWHGPLEERQYYKRIKEFGKHLREINNDNIKDKNGLTVAQNPVAAKYVSDYFDRREGVRTTDNFGLSMLAGYATDNALLGTVIGGNPIGAIVGEALNPGNQTGSTENNRDSNNDWNNSDSVGSQPDDNSGTQPSENYS